MLDGTVAIHRLRLVRGDDAPLAWHRTYFFDYTADGYARQRGFVVMTGEQRGHRGPRPAPGMNTPSPVDLHLHSTASDGVLDPAALVAHVAACGVGLMALTDHDTVAGVEAAAVAARAPASASSPASRSPRTGAAGPSTSSGSRSTRPPAPRRRARLAAGLRVQRAERIAARLDAAGAPGAAALAVDACRRLPAADAHALRARARGCGRRGRRGLGFRPLARPRPPGHVPSEWPELDEATAWILAAGGKAAIAHPLRYTLSAGARREMCTEFRAGGGHGVEVVTGGSGPAQREQAISLAVRCGLEGSVGSDFHDPAVPWNPPGRLAKLPDSIRPIWSDFPPA